MLNSKRNLSKEEKEEAFYASPELLEADSLHDLPYSNYLALEATIVYP